METIGTKILEIRKRKGLTQEELSDQSLINLRTLQRIEKGETEPRGNTLKNLCRVLEINIEDVLDYGRVEDAKYLKYFHLSVLTFMLIPFGNIFLPLILWLTKRDKIVNLNEQGINLLNYQILWSLLLNFCILSFALVKILHLGNHYIIAFLVGLLYFINIVYPIVVSVQIGKGRLKKFYFSVIPFISK